MMSDNGKWQIYAEAAAISYKSEQQISYWRDQQYARLLRRTRNFNTFSGLLQI